MSKTVGTVKVKSYKCVDRTEGNNAKWYSMCRKHRYRQNQ